MASSDQTSLDDQVLITLRSPTLNGRPAVMTPKRISHHIGHFLIGSEWGPSSQAVVAALGRLETQGLVPRGARRSTWVADRSERRCELVEIGDISQGEMVEFGYSDDTRRALAHIEGRTTSGLFANQLYYFSDKRWEAAIEPLRRDGVIEWTHGTVADDPPVTGGWVLAERQRRRDSAEVEAAVRAHNAAQRGAYAREQEPDLGLEAGEITWRDRPERNERIYEHKGCARWVVPHDGLPAPGRGESKECVECAQVLPLVALDERNVDRAQERVTLRERDDDLGLER